MGRPMVRKAERFRANINCSLSCDEKVMNFKTFDISENGFSLLLDYPDYIPDRPGIQIILHSDLYQCSFVGELVNVMQFGDDWKYAFVITSIDDFEKDNLYSLVYDRQPSLPTKLGKSISFLDDLTINLFRRMKQPMGYNRKLARVPLDKTLNSEQSGPVIINDFNYEYMLVSSRHQLSNHQTITIDVSEKCKIRAVLKRQYIIKRTKDKSESKRKNPFVYLFQITNVEDIVDSKEFKEKMMVWIQEARTKKIEQLREEKRRAKNSQYADEFYERNYLS
jgi:cellulose synthase (UDP-forming)